jgi:hypothetical protein
MVKNTVMVFFIGRTETNTKDNGGMTKEMEKVCFTIEKEVNTKASVRTILLKVMGCVIGQMEINMKVNGKMV